ncbi:MAG: hypothetical protein H6652_21875 [Ardenticatenaceae bacterium]|nr:hypothetical protein [Ardenticatenaceae bacterium]
MTRAESHTRKTRPGAAFLEQGWLSVLVGKVRGGTAVFVGARRDAPVEYG